MQRKSKRASRGGGWPGPQDLGGSGALSTGSGQGSWWRARPGPRGEGSRGGAGEGRAAGGTAGDSGSPPEQKGPEGHGPPASEQLGERELRAWEWGGREAWEGTGEDIKEARRQSCRVTPAWGPCGCPGWARSWGGEQDPRIGDVAGGAVKEQSQGRQGTATGRSWEGTEHQTTCSSNTALIYWGAGVEQQNPQRSAG